MSVAVSIVNLIFWLPVVLNFFLLWCLFNDNFQFGVFSWEEFCRDTALEKAAWFVDSADHMSGSTDRSMDFNQANCLKSFRSNHQAISSPNLHELQPPLRSQRRYTRF